MPPVLRSNPLYREEEEQEVVIIVDSLEEHVEPESVAPRVPRRAPSTSSGYGSGGGSAGRVSPTLPKIEYTPDVSRCADTERSPASDSDCDKSGSRASESASDDSPDCTLSRSLKDDIRACLGVCRWDKEVSELVAAAARGAGGVCAARARLHAALRALHEPPAPLPAPPHPATPYCGPGVRPGDVTMRPKHEMSLLAASALFTLDGARGEALARRLARGERRRRRCRAVLAIAALLLLLAAVCAVELLMSRGQRVFGAVLR
ncbi:PREDICTED: uncharacterized protein LOC106102546 [Papilio polytes]|uniref:uncharacterized protein LOC106102546 n=1 Tax=Papilio polytes TaxID=76194 RepID=UPI0006762BAD|nr:PREDICTED: uncharacterized protein LOC106102546 [Papilio polytes]